MSEIKPEVMLSLGGYEFSVKTAEYQELQKKHSWRWTSRERKEGTQALHFEGPNAIEITLNGTIYVESKADVQQLAEMKAKGDSGVPLGLVSGSQAYGTSLGQWCMLELSETQTHFLPDGTPTKFTFSIRLQQYVEY